MTCYKVVRMSWTGWGMRGFITRWVTRAVIPNSLLDIHRKLYCWMDEWCDLTREQIVALEVQTAEATRALLKKHEAAAGCEAAAGGGAAGGGAAAPGHEPSAFEYEYFDE
jgi:Phosphatidylinositol transfer protein